MENDHLQNTIAYLIRTAPEAMEENLYAGFTAMASFNPDSMANYYAECEVSSMKNETVEDFLNEQPIFRALVKEAKRRKLPDYIFP